MRSLIVVSGGDAPGINLFVAHYTQLAALQGHAVLGANGGFSGLFAGQVEELTIRNTLPFAEQGGTWLASSRNPVLTQPDAKEKLLAILQAHEIDTIVLQGGNGTLHHIPPALRNWGISHIGIPTTIDNDVAGSERTLGFDSACNYAMNTVDGILATARGLPGRVFLLETLGGNSGYLALAIAASAHAHAVLIPEYEVDLPHIAGRISQALEQFGYALVVASEGIEDIDGLPDRLHEHTGIRIRHTRLGHAQRGCAPSYLDRRFAIELAEFAYVQATKNSSGLALVCNNQLELFQSDLSEFTLVKPDLNLYQQMNGQA